MTLDNYHIQLFFLSRYMRKSYQGSIIFVLGCKVNYNFLIYCNFYAKFYSFLHFPIIFVHFYSHFRIKPSSLSPEPKIDREPQALPIKQQWPTPKGHRLCWSYKKLCVGRSLPVANLVLANEWRGFRSGSKPSLGQGGLGSSDPCREPCIIAAP